MTKQISSKSTKKWLKDKIKNIINGVNQEKAAEKGADLSKYALKEELFINFFPYMADSSSYIIPKVKEEVELCEQGLPIPPRELWLGYGQTKEEYLYWAKPQVQTMLDTVKKSGLELTEKKRILELGCGAGRMLRWLKPYSEKCEIWGTDISSEHIYWANKYLKPYFNFATTTTIPHLPFEDRYFDLIYAGSVFTHIDDLTDAWLLELRRTLSDNGRIYITIQDKNTIKIIKDHPIWRESKVAKYLSEFPKIMNGEENFGVFVTLRGPASLVFYDIEYFCESVSNIFDVVSVTQKAYGHQTAVLLKRKD